MRRRQDCRKRIVQTALKLFATRGYYNTSIADILRESDCKRGSLYHYFSSKEELGYAAIDESFRLFAEHGAASHLATEGHPIDRLFKILDDLPSSVKLEPSGIVTGGIAARMATVHEGFRKRLAERLEAQVEQLEGMVRSGVVDGQIVDSVDPDEVAHMFATMSMGIQYTNMLLRREVIWEDARRWLKKYLNSLRK